MVKPAANKPAADKAAELRAKLKDKLAAALAGTALPAATDGAAWLALLNSLPAVAEEIAKSPSGKYKDKSACASPSLLFANSKAGIGMAASGETIIGSGRVTVQGAVCMAVAAAQAATGAQNVCKAAIVFYMITSPVVLDALHKTKSAGNGRCKVQYIGKTGVPCPAWCAGYVQGNGREGFCTIAQS